MSDEAGGVVPPIATLFSLRLNIASRCPGKGRVWLAPIALEALHEQLSAQCNVCDKCRRKARRGGDSERLCEKVRSKQVKVKSRE